MIEIAANPTPESLKILLVVTLSVLSILVLLVGYLLARRDAAITAATENLTVIVGQLKELVNGLTTQYSIRQPLVDEQLKSHSAQLSNHNDSITKLQTEHEMLHCRYPRKNVRNKKTTE
jgi:hypothetical protein